MRPRWLLAVAVFAIGCAGGADPKNSRLEVGQEAYLCNEKVPGNADPGDMLYLSSPRNTDGLLLVPIPLGTKVRVGSDQQSDKGGVPGSREVLIRLLEGEHAGKAVVVDRTRLRPAK